MKRVMYVIGLGLLSGSLWAACVNGHYCADDTGASIDGLTVGKLTNTGTTTNTGVVTNSAAVGLFSQTLAQIQASTSTAAGQIVFCSNCVQSHVCISTGTTLNDYVVVGGTVTVGGADMACR